MYIDTLVLNMPVKSPNFIKLPQNREKKRCARTTYLPGATGNRGLKIIPINWSRTVYCIYVYMCSIHVYRFCYTQATAVQVAYPRANDKRTKGKKINNREKKSSVTLGNYHPMMVLSTKMVL